MTDQRLTHILDLLEALHQNTTEGKWFETSEAIGSPAQEGQALLLKCDQSVTMNEDAEFAIEAHNYMAELITLVKHLQEEQGKTSED